MQTVISSSSINSNYSSSTTTTTVVTKLLRKNEEQVWFRKVEFKKVIMNCCCFGKGKVGVDVRNKECVVPITPTTTSEQPSRIFSPNLPNDSLVSIKRCLNRSEDATDNNNTPTCTTTTTTAVKKSLSTKKESSVDLSPQQQQRKQAPQSSILISQQTYNKNKNQSLSSLTIGNNNTSNIISPKFLLDNNSNKELNSTTTNFKRNNGNSSSSYMQEKSSRKSEEKIPILNNKENSNCNGSIVDSNCCSSKSIKNEKETDVDYKEPEKNGNYFKLVMEKEEKRFNRLIESTERHLSSQNNINEEIKGKLRSVIGKTRLLTTKKFKQFDDLCAKNLTQDENTQFKTTNEDLAGFWDLILIQIDDINSMYDEIDNLRNNNWHLESKKSTINNTNTPKTTTTTVRPRPKTKTNNLKLSLDPNRNMERRRELMEAKKKMKEKLLLENANIQNPIQFMSEVK